MNPKARVFLDTSVQVERLISLNQRRVAIEQLKANPKSIKDQPRVERLLVAILQDSRAGLGQSACWPLGDLFILLQVPPDAMIWSFDADFQVLAEVLALKQYLVPSK